MSNTAARSAASGGVSRSNSNVASPPWCSTVATCWLRGLWRLLPLPWTNTTRPAAPAGTVRCPGRHRVRGQATTSSSCHCARSVAGRPRRPVLDEQVPDLFVGGRREIPVPLPDRRQPLQRPDADHLVAVAQQRFDHIGGRDRDGEDDAGGASGAGNLGSGPRVDPVAMPSSTMTTVRPARSIAGSSPRSSHARRRNAANSARSTTASCSSLIPTCLMMRGLRRVRRPRRWRPWRAQAAAAHRSCGPR